MNGIIKKILDSAVFAVVLVTATWLLNMLVGKINIGWLNKTLAFPAGAGGFSFGGFTVALVIAVMITIAVNEPVLKALKLK